MSGGFEINLEALDSDDFRSGLRAEAGQEEIRECLVTAQASGLIVSLHFDDQTEVDGHVAEVGAGVVEFEQFERDENDHMLIAISKIVWVKVKRRV